MVQSLNVYRAFIYGMLGNVKSKVVALLAMHVNIMLILPNLCNFLDLWFKFVCYIKLPKMAK
jgi:hypothetical protein